MLNAFNLLKDSIAEKVLLHYPDDSKPFMIWTDASAFGLGAWIAQKHGEEKKTLCFASRALSKSEKNYSATKRELLGIVWALQKFRAYLF